MRVAVSCVLALLACNEERVTSRPVPVEAPTVAEPPPLPPEADLGRTCKSDSDCSPAAPRCLAFDTEGHVHPRGELACTRDCLGKRCPAGFQCSTLGYQITNAVTGKLETHRAGWCGRKREPVRVETMAPGKVLRWSSRNLDDAPILVVLRDGTVRVVQTYRYPDDPRNHDLVFGAADARQGIAAFRELVARGGYLGPTERTKLANKKVPPWPRANPPTGEATAHELLALGHFLPPGLLEKLVTAGVLAKAMWPRDAKLHVIDANGARAIPLVDIAAFDAELARE